MKENQNDADDDDGAEAGSAIAGRARAAAMRSVNPIVIPRNHREEEALAAASDEGDLAPLERLLDALRQPYDEGDDRGHYAEPAPAHVTAHDHAFCGTCPLSHPPQCPHVSRGGASNGLRAEDRVSGRRCNRPAPVP